MVAVGEKKRILCASMKRRDFIKASALLAAAAGTGEILKASTFAETDSVSASRQDDLQENRGGLQDDKEKLIASAPMLQNFAATSMGVAFAVSALANGYVLVGEKADLSDARKVLCGGYRVTDLDDRVVRVRLTGLKSSTRYYYQIGADRIRYDGGYRMGIIGNEEDPRIYSFTTAGPAREAHFCVINDTHARWEPFGLAVDKIAELSPACVIWNGDASNVEETVEAQVRIFLKPEIEKKDYAAGVPYLFCPGNHDDRGMANRHLERVWMFRQPEERLPRDWDLGRNFAVRLGDVALIGLDTAEDKLDTNPKFAGLFTSGPYREAQTAWLRDALAREEIRTAPFLVAVCHIPLFDDNPRHNPGDVAPADSDPQYSTDFAYWQRTCARMWAPLLEEAGCQVVITAHQHRYRYDAPGTDAFGNVRSWAQIVGGGPEMGFTGSGDNRRDDPGKFPTVIEGLVRNGRLEINVHNLLTQTVQDQFLFAPRR
ncbi:MAG: metallophosphoesterase family protein [Schwartzia sp.]|nr:metallophosphoesterase family protein [Schwartzia sp. (in: firmicutes)]